MARYSLDELATQNDTSPAQVKALLVRLGLRRSGVVLGEDRFSPTVATAIGQAFTKMRSWQAQAAAEKGKTE